MKIEFLGWKTQGLLCADMDVDFSISGDKSSQLNIILMQNGCGKTTLTTLIRDTLTGQIRNWNKEKIMEFQSKDEPGKQGEFVLIMLFNGKKATFTVKFDFDNTTLSIETSSPQQGGHHSKYRPPVDAREFLKPEFAQYFIYDGEEAENFFKAGENKTTQALTTLYGLNHLEQIKNDANDYFEVLRKKSETGKSADSKVNEIKNKISEFEKRKDVLEGTLEDKNEEKQEYQNRIMALDVEISSLSSSDIDLRQELEDVKEKIFEIQNKLMNEAKSVWDHIKNPANLDLHINSSLLEFTNNLDKLKLPEQSNEQFFDELVKEDECVCGREINGEIKKVILDNSKKYMGSKHTEFINAMKTQVKEYIDNDKIMGAKDLRKNLDNHIKDRNKLTNEKTKIERLLKADSGRSVAQINKEKKELEKKIHGIDYWREGYEAEDKTVRPSTPAIRINSHTTVLRRLDELREEQASIKGLNKKYRAIRKLGTLLDQTKSDAIDLIRLQVKDQMNELIPKIITQDKIEVEEISEVIKTQHSKGSAGQKLVLGYIFLSTITNKNETENQLPLLVDSPCGATDDVNRQGLARYLPGITNQLILLIHVAERQYFGDELMKNDDGNSSYNTIFRITPETEHFINQKPNELKLFKRSAQVSTKEFFKTFEVVGGDREDREARE